ncbi:MAG: PLDc_N domain-containing protein [bacterium]|nr:PLDc_N domain-containing protein [bacterium]
MFLIPLLGFLFVAGGTLFWIWMIIDCATKESSEGNDKIIWILVIVLTHWIGALIYFLVRRPQRIAELGQ